MAAATPHGPGARLHEPFDHPVLDRMKGHHRKLSTGAQRALGGLQPVDQRCVFVIHRDPDRLKAARGGMGLARLGARQAALDDPGQVQRGLDPRLRARPTDGPRDPTARALFAVKVQDIGQFRLGHLIHQISGAQARLAHPHVERAVAHEGKAPPGLVKLHRRHAEIEHDTVEIFGVVVHPREIALDQPQPVTVSRAPTFGHAQRGRITVHADHPFRPGLEQPARIAPAPSVPSSQTPETGATAARSGRSRTGTWPASSGVCAAAAMAQTPPGLSSSVSGSKSSG